MDLGTFSTLRSHTLIRGDSRHVLKLYPNEYFAAVVCDPPYELREKSHRSPDGATPGKGYRGETWDGSGVPMDAWFWRQVYRVMKPGAYMVAFGGSRTVHRMTVAIEDAGFEIRDLLAWVYGSGFPKAKSILRPSMEPIVLARKAYGGTIAESLKRYGTGQLDIDALRMKRPEPAPPAGETPMLPGFEGLDFGVKAPAPTPPAQNGQYVVVPHPEGFWPPNVIISHSALCEPGDCADDCGHRLLGDKAELFAQVTLDQDGYNPAAFVSKPSLGERDEGLEVPIKSKEFIASGKQGKKPNKLNGEWNPRVGIRSPRRNHHPTVKPTGIMEWLVTLICPPGLPVLDPFSGSGTTGIVAGRKGIPFVGVDIDEDDEWTTIAMQRFRYHFGPLLLADPVRAEIDPKAGSYAIRLDWL